MKDTLDFLVIGAAKAGTTSLFEYLRVHPEIAVPPDKEAPYFSRDTVYARGWEAYLAREFPREDPSRRWGTVTPDYMAGSVFERALTLVTPGTDYDEWTVPRRICAQLPDVRLIALLREPVARTRSQYAMEVLNGNEAEPFPERAQELLESSALEKARRSPTRTNSYVVWSEYARILKPYVELFSLERLLIVFHSDLEHAPGEVVRRVYDFVGVDPTFVPGNLGERYRVGAAERRVSSITPDQIQRELSQNPLAKSVWHLLPESARRRTDHRVRRLSYRFELRNRRGARTTAMPGFDADMRLRNHFSEDAVTLSHVTRTLPPWGDLSTDEPADVR